MTRSVFLRICLCVCFLASFIAKAEGAPVIKKLGTVDCDLVETTPIVFHDKLYLFESVRDNYKPNATGKSYFQFVDVATGERTPPFARGYHLGCAFVNGDDVYVYGVDKWGASSVHVFWSKDLGVWKDQTAMDLGGWRIFNTSVCKGADGFMMAFEIDAPKEETGNGFTMRFAKSDDLRNWRLTPSECVYTKERYSACPSLRFVDGNYYMVYLEAYPGPMYEPCIVRSKDLIKWEESPNKPIMKHSDEDKLIANKTFSDKDKYRIENAENLNNSDVDFCQFKNKTVIYYSWGNQQGVEHLAHAEYEGTETEFLKGFFPAP